MNLPFCPVPQPLPRCEWTDLPRLFCPCNEHTNWNATYDYEDLEPVELEYLTRQEAK